MKRLASKLYIITSGLLIFSMASAAAYYMNENMQGLPIQQYFSASYKNAVWDWTSPANRQESELQPLREFLKLHQINTVFLDISQINGINNIVSQEEKNAKLDQFSKSVQKYIGEMKTSNINVFAAAGNVEWSKPENQDIPKKIQKYVFDYNENYKDEPFAGIEFDIESYNQEGFPEASFTEKELVLLEYLDLVEDLTSSQQTYNKDKNTNLELGFAIPYWYDNSNQNIKSVSWNDKTGPVLFHTLDILNRLDKSNVVVMAYRNAAQGNDGMIYLSRTEVDYAQSKAQNVDVIIGTEVNDVEPEKITFYGKTKSELSNEVRIVTDEFSPSGVYGGIAINDLTGFQELQ